MNKGVHSGVESANIIFTDNLVLVVLIFENIISSVHFGK